MDRNVFSLITGAGEIITGTFPATGPPVPDPILANLTLWQLSEDVVAPNTWVLSPSDRLHILHWLFKFSENSDSATGPIPVAAETAQTCPTLIPVVGLPTRAIQSAVILVFVLIAMTMTPAPKGIARILPLQTPAAETRTPVIQIAAILVSA